MAGADAQTTSPTSQTPPAGAGSDADDPSGQTEAHQHAAGTLTSLGASRAEDSIYHDQATPYQSGPDALHTSEQSFTQTGPAMQPLDTSALDSNPIPTSEIKTEDSPMPQIQVDPSVDRDTKNAILAASNEHGTRLRKPTPSATGESATSAPSPSESTPRPTGPPKKRSAPRSKKDPNAPKAKRPPAKKRRLDAEGNGSPSLSQRSATPHGTTTRKPSRASAAQRKSSVAAESNSDAQDDSEAESVNSEDQNLYCICRKQDNHTWMIACDGGCNDWYHGKCVSIDQRDEPLIDKYICPSCEEKGNAVTTWKPMCRREGCRGPARLKKGGESKYCSDECGKSFMRQILERMPGGHVVHGRQGSRSLQTQPIDYEPLGGPIHVAHLKSVVIAAENIKEFKNLGEAALPSPPITPGEDQRPAVPEVELTPREQQRLSEIVEEKERLREQRSLLKDREKLVTMVKEQLSRVEKGQCGFDQRLSLDDEAFSEWRNSEQGKTVFERGSLDESQAAPSGDQMDIDRPALVICLRKRCGRHHGWPKLSLQDVRFEEASLVEKMHHVDKEEKDLRERAWIRKRDKDADGDENMVEVVG